MCDRKGVIYQGRDKVDQFKSAHAIKTKFRTLEEVMKNADVFSRSYLQKTWSLKR